MRIIACLFTVSAALLLPVGAAVILMCLRKKYTLPVILGVLTFTVFQVLTRIPLIQLVLPNMSWYIVMNTAFPAASALFAGATAGLFEEFGRYAVMTLFMKNNRRLSDGIAFGIGHGGIEAVLFTGINSAAMLITGQYPAGADMIFLAGIERIFAMAVHIGFSVIILRAVNLKKPFYLLLAFVLHTLVDSAAVLMQLYNCPALVIEAAIGVSALAILAYSLIISRKKEDRTV